MISNHGSEFRALGQGIRVEGLEEVRGLAIADLRLAEDYDNGIKVLDHGLIVPEVVFPVSFSH